MSRGWQAPMRTPGCQKGGTIARLLKFRCYGGMLRVVCALRQVGQYWNESQKTNRGASEKWKITLLVRIAQNLALQLRAHAMKTERKTIPRTTGAHLSLDVSRGPWSRILGPLPLYLMSSSWVISNFREKPKENRRWVAWSHCRVRGSVVLTPTPTLLLGILKKSISVLTSQICPCNFQIQMFWLTVCVFARTP